jgi:hypothetical protein
MKTNNRNSVIDLSKFEKVEDIIFLDEPILTHLKRKDKDFLFYLVDTIDELDIFLLIETSEDIIYEYITKKISLRDIILQNENICHLIEQDFSGNILNVQVTQSELISEDYLPNENSFLEYEPSDESYYYNFIKEYESKFYLASLREKAFYIKFAPNDKKYLDTIGFNDLVNNLLSNISSSFKNFLKADFLLEFKYIQTDKNKLQSTFNRLLPDLDFRMVDLKFGSFEIGLAVDKVMKGSIENRQIKDWAINVGNKYKDIVLDKNYDEKTVNKILESYDADERKRIFEPIFKITENPNFRLQIKENKNSKYSTINIQDKSVIKKIIPPKFEAKDLSEHKEYEIIQIIRVQEKNSLSRSIKLDDNSLFDLTDTTEFSLKNKDFEKFGYKLDFPVSIPLNISTDKDLIIISTQFEDIDFRETTDTGKIDDGIKKITTSIYEYIMTKNE